jgi:hypothetical protein
MLTVEEQNVALVDLWLYFLSGREPKKDSGVQYLNAYIRASDPDKQAVRELIEKPWSETATTIYSILEKTL